MPNLLRWLTFLFCITILFSCSDDNEENNSETTSLAKRTVLMYVSAQNSLGYKNFQEQDSVEISRGHQFIDKDHRLLVYMDDEYNPRIYQYTAKSEHPLLLRQWEKEANSSSPEVLQDVLNWTKTNFPAEEYGMVMWSHSDGWLPSTNKEYSRSYASTYSFGIDVGENGEMKYDEDASGNVGAQMDIEDMKTAIQKSGIHFKYIFFDSCLMQNLEVGYTLRDVTDFIIAAPIQIPGCGGNYTHLLEKGLFTKAEYDIVDTYTEDATKGFNDFNSEYYDYGIVISTLRTSELEALAQTTADVLSRSSLLEKKSPNMSDVLHYQAYTSRYYFRPHNYDASEAMKKILDKADFERYQTALNKAIVHKGATPKFWIGPGNYDMGLVDLEKYCGVSTFIPQNIYEKNAKYCIYGDLNKAFQATSWYKAAGWEVTGW